MALTNLASAPHNRDRIVTLGGWAQAVQFLIGFNPDRDTAGQAKTVLAVCELLSNLSLSDQIQERAGSSPA